MYAKINNYNKYVGDVRSSVSTVHTFKVWTTVMVVMPLLLNCVGSVGRIEGRASSIDGRIELFKSGNDGMLS